MSGQQKETGRITREREQSEAANHRRLRHLGEQDSSNQSPRDGDAEAQHDQSLQQVRPGSPLVGARQDIKA